MYPSTLGNVIAETNIFLLSPLIEVTKDKLNVELVKRIILHK